jgi:hypothetical protein
MRTWVKVTIAGGAIVVLAVIALAGTGAYYFFRHLNRHQATEADARRDFEAIRARFQGRPPLIEIVDPKAADVRVNRLEHPGRRRSETLHVLSWKTEDGELMKADLPVWLMRFSSVNLFSQIGVMPSRFRLTLDDLQRYGPGIVVDYRPPGGTYVLIWMD